MEQEKLKGEALVQNLLRPYSKKGDNKKLTFSPERIIGLYPLESPLAEIERTHPIRLMEMISEKEKPFFFPQVFLFLEKCDGVSPPQGQL